MSQNRVNGRHVWRTCGYTLARGMCDRTGGAGGTAYVGRGSLFVLRLCLLGPSYFGFGLAVVGCRVWSLDM